MESVKIYLLDKPKSNVQYGLNWGQRENREPNQAYLQLEQDIYKSDFFPKKGKYFVVDTDDHTTLIFNRAQKTADGCALQTPENNSIIGLYLRKRLGIVNGAKITRDDILNYGKLDIDVFKVDDLHFFLNFSKNWKTKDIRYIFEQYLLIYKRANNWTEVNKIIANLDTYSTSSLKGKFLNKGIFETTAFKDLAALLTQRATLNAPDEPNVQTYIKFLESDFLKLHYGEHDMKATSSQLSLDTALQLIYYGAPGTGKSNNIKKRLEQDNIPKENIFRTTFHPDSDYSTFVGAYKPTMQKRYRYDGKVKAKYYEDDDLAGKKKDDFMVDKTIEYCFVPQAFLNAYMQAYRTSEDVYLIIEEINRGNCAQIFGDLFQLLDRDDESGYSEYPIKADADLRAFLEEELGKGNTGIKDGELRLPPNLYIYATMNTSDQSLFPIDSAFKRRWDWKYIPICNAKKGWVIEVGGKHYDWWDFLEKINEKIGTTTNSEDKKLGYFFCKAKSGVISAETFTGKVIFYLWNDVFKDYDFSDSIFSDENGGKLTFDKFHTTEGCESKVVAEKIALFLKNLDVVPKNESVEMPDNNEDEDTNRSDDKTKNYDKFTVNGGKEIAKKNLAFECITEFIRLHPEMPATEVYNTWASLGDIVPHFVETAEQYDARTDSSKRSYPLDCAGTKIYVAWNGYGDPDGRADLLMEKVNSQDWGITIKRIPKKEAV